MKTLKLLLVLAAVLPITATGQKVQVLEPLTTPLEQMKTLAEMKGDLNGDGIEDGATICDYNGPKLFIFLSDKEAFSVKPLIYEKFLFELPADVDDNSVSYDLGMTDDNCLAISVMLDYSMSGSYAVPTGTYIYRYQNGDFYLISDTHTDLYANTGEEFSVINDYLKGKRCNVSLLADKNKNLKRKAKWTKVGKKPLRKLGEDVLTAE
ncbi:MAG: hypothetical protein IK053_08260 [Muribaculaceae bacterium]|nr:hypothetical protein [Muribaculaceae bacterium]